MLNSNAPILPLRLMAQSRELAGVGERVVDPMGTQDVAHPVRGESLGYAVESDRLPCSQANTVSTNLHLLPIHKSADALESFGIRQPAFGIQTPQRLDGRVEGAIRQ